MRASKWLAGTLAVFLLSGTLTGCTMLRTPYEQQKMKEEAGKKKPAEEGEGGGEKKEAEGGDAAEMAGKPDEDKAKDKEKSNVTETRELPRAMEEKYPRLLYNQQLSTVVSQVEGVTSATVLLDDEHKAFVSLTAPDVKAEEMEVEENEKLHVKTEGEIPQKTQEKIAKSLRKSDPLIEEVYITNNPRHVENFNRYATRSLKGDVDDNRSKALAEHIQDIWK